MTKENLPIVKLIDFGSSRSIKRSIALKRSKEKHYSSTSEIPILIAPEKFKIQFLNLSVKITDKVDVYDVGLTLLLISSNIEKDSRLATFKDILAGKCAREGAQTLQGEKSAHFLLFLNSCLATDPKDRPSADELLRHDWFGDRVGDRVSDDVNWGFCCCL